MNWRTALSWEAPLSERSRSLKDELVAPETREQALKAFEAYAKTFSGSYMVK